MSSSPVNLLLKYRSKIFSNLGYISILVQLDKKFGSSSYFQSCSFISASREFNIQDFSFTKSCNHLEETFNLLEERLKNWTNFLRRHICLISNILSDLASLTFFYCNLLFVSFFCHMIIHIILSLNKSNPPTLVKLSSHRKMTDNGLWTVPGKNA